MKVGILTFHSAMNFGAVLQCHGLYKTIKQLGHDVSVIDYRPPYLYVPRPEVGKKEMLIHPIRSYKKYKRTTFWRERYDKFFKFQKKEWKTTSVITDTNNLKKITNTFDVIVVGSDQIWNESLNGNDQPWYGFTDSKAKWITYAASAGDANLSDKSKKLLQNTLINFSSISVRETRLADIISCISTENQIPVVLDPTLLADHKCWKKWTQPIIEEDYIVVYQARPNDNTFRIAGAIGEQINVKKIVVLDVHKNVKRLGYDTYNASPQDFVSLIANCRCLVTTSFHGTAFSIICQVPFYTLRLNDGADERSTHLLTQLQLGTRIIDSDSNPKFSIPDYSSCNETLSRLRVEALDYLSHCI